MSGGVTVKLQGIGDVERVFAELADEIGDKKATSRFLIPAMSRGFSVAQSGR
jgi:hypothetical protein